MSFSIYRIVSIPHRYARNLCYRCGVHSETCVSIPHRYARNVKIQWMYLNITLVSIPHRYARNPVVACLSTWLLWGFQFLIGTLETLDDGRYVEAVECVSIPHRYARNVPAQSATYDPTPSFNSS